MRALLVTLLCMTTFAGVAGADTDPWRPVGSDVARPLDESQGLAVVERPVAGEWGTMDRLLVHPMPGVAHTDPAANLRVVVLSPSICVMFDSKTWRFQR